MESKSWLPKIHELKCWPKPFEDIKKGLKTFEFRKNDRDFKEGDTIVLALWNPETKEYGHSEVSYTIPYIIYGPDFGIPEGYCIMSIGLEILGNVEFD